MTARPMAAAFIIENGKLLLVHNIKHGLRIEPPGGKVHDGESFEDACIREVKEELGVDVEVLSLFSTHTIDTPEGVFDVQLFLCRILKGELQEGLEPQKISGFHWYTYKELEQVEKDGTLVPDVCEALSRIREHLSA